MKIWVDDIRPSPPGWYWAKTSEAALILLNSALMAKMPPEIMSLDHDLGDDDTTRPIVLWCCENDFWPKEVLVHSANPPGAYWLEQMIERYHPSTNPDLRGLK